MKIFGMTVTREKALQTVPSNRGWWSVIREAFGGAWQKDVRVTDQDLIASPAVYSCIALIANDIGKLRARVVEVDANGIWAETKVRSEVLARPNHYQNHIQFKQWWLTSKLRFGNAYALKHRDDSGRIVRLHVLDPERVTPLITEDGGVYYRLKADQLFGIPSELTVPASEIIHDRMNCMFHPLVGVSPLHAAAIAAGIGAKIQDNTLKFFSNRATPSGILVAPGNIGRDTALAIKEDWQKGYTGENSGKVAVFGDGMKFEPMSSNAVDSQLIETLKWSDERVCSVFHVPAYKVGVGQAPSYNNIEAQNRAYYSDCLQARIEELEAALDDGLGYNGHTIGIELDLDGLMRMDSKTHMETLKIGVDANLLTTNDGRKRLNLPPLDGGDTIYMQQQDFPLNQVRHNKLPAPQEVQP